MISCTNISVQFGGKVLFRDISFRIGPKDRIGLIGSNGTGKSTLLRLLLGDRPADSGEVAKAKFVTVGYLPQEGTVASGRTLYDEAQSVFKDIMSITEHLDDIHRRMDEMDHETNEFQELLTLYGELQHRLEDTEAFRMKSNIERVLSGLGFSETDGERRTEEFSGGWQMRIALAKLLLQQPSLLLLDEPTNHLDLDSLRWLEDYLRGYDGAVIIVSHDSRFLDSMTDRTLELSRGALTEFSGNFTFSLRAKNERKEQEVAEFQTQQRKIKETRRFIERFRYKATKARQVQSRIKALEKMELIELEDEEKNIRFTFPPAPPGGRAVIELRGVIKSFGEAPLFEGIDFDIERGDRIAFVGVNGAGKSTLSRIIAGEEDIQGGERIVGHNISVSYFAQHQAEELEPGNTVLETVDEVATGDLRKRLRTILGCFLFHGDDVFKSVRVLSGGEKSRLALAKMLLQPANLLVLDEPTNHLDMRSKAVLVEALLQYNGSCVIVSHDRDFLDPLVNKVVEFKRGHITTFPGNVSEYIDRIGGQPEARGGGETISGASRSGDSAKERRRKEAEKRQHRYRQIKPIRNKLDKVEELIEQKERVKKELEARMSDPELFRDPGGVRELNSSYETIVEELDAAYHEWNDLTKQLEMVDADSTEGGKQ